MPSRSMPTVSYYSSAPLSSSCSWVAVRSNAQRSLPWVAPWTMTARDLKTPPSANRTGNLREKPQNPRDRCTSFGLHSFFFLEVCMRQPLWVPSKVRQSASNISRFIEYLNRTHRFQISSYPQLYDWSVNELSDFWAV